MEAKMSKHTYNNLILKLHDFYIYMYIMYFCNLPNCVIISIWTNMTFKLLGCFVSCVSQWSVWSLLHAAHIEIYLLHLTVV